MSLEDVYEEALAWKLLQSGLHVQRKTEVPVKYKENLLKTPLELDLLVNNLVIIECRSVLKHHEVIEAQVLTYLHRSISNWES